MFLGTLTSTFEGHNGGVYALQFVDNMIISCSADSTIRVYDTRTEKSNRTLEGHNGEVTCIQFDKETCIC